MFFTFYKIKERNQKNTLALLLENCLSCVPVCFTLVGSQFCTPLNTAVVMALCCSGEGQMKIERNVERKGL